jgi:DnaJ homolog subfamily C member 28
MSETNERRGPVPHAPDAKTGNLRRWRDLVEEQLSEARERGDFDGLEGSGKPLRLDQNVFAGDRALAYSLLKQNKLLPPEIERGREIDADLAQSESLLAGLRRRTNTLQRYEAALRAANSKILSLNITAPSALHRRPLDVERLLTDFAAEFPPVEG